MSRFVLDCAVSRAPDARSAGWLAAAAQRAWAAPSGGYHEAKTAYALLVESQNAVAGLVGGAAAWFTPDPSSAVAHAVLDLGVRGDFEVVLCAETDPMVLQEQSRAAASQLSLPHRLVPVDGDARLVASELPAHALLVTAAANQEVGTLQADLGAWAEATGSAVVLEATCAYGWSDLPKWWERLVLDPRAWGGPAGAVAVVSRTAGRPRLCDNVPAAVAAGLTGQRWRDEAPAQRDRVRAQITRIRDRVLGEVPDVHVLGGRDEDLPHILSISVLYVDAEALQTRLDAAGYAVGSGSACASRSGQPSHVLAVIGGLTSGNVRIGLPPDLPDAAVDGFVDTFVTLVRGIRDEMGTTDL